MKRNLIAIVLVGAVILAAAMIAPVLGSPGGVGNKNLQANSCSAHNIVSTSNTVTVTASKLNPAPSEQITVTASLSGSGGSGSKAGIALFTALSGSSGTAPADKGWTIVTDPSGTTYNYNEKSYSGSASFAWTMKAPAAAGTYSIYARAYMGPTFNYKDAAAPLTFTVASAAVVSAPTVTVTAPASGATVSGTFSVTATATAGTGASISSVDLKVDSVSVGAKTVSPYTWSINSASYTNAAHTLNITATDSAGRKGYAQISVTVSNAALLPPTVSITTPASGATLTGTATITATATPSGTATVSSVALSIDGTSVGTKTSSPYTWSVNTAIYAKGAHTILVAATDSNAKQGTAQISVTVNNDPASVTITSPTNGATVSGTVSVSASGTPPAGQTLTNMELKVDGVSKGAVTAAPYTWSVNTNDLANGQHIYNVTSTSSLGSKSYRQISVTYNNQPIAVVISSPANGAIMAGTASVAASISSAQTVTFGSLYVDGALFNNKTAAPFSWSVSTLTLANGQHTLSVVGGDSAGRIARQQISVTVNNAPVSVTFTAPANGAIIKGTMTVSANALSSATVSWVRLTMDGKLIGNKTAAQYTWSIASTGYSDGQHTLLVEMMDSLGRKASSQIVVTFNNSGTAVPVPVVTVTNPTNGASISGDVTVTAQVTSAKAITNVVLTMDGKVIGQKTASPYTWTLSTATLVDGQHALNVSATDSGGKIGYNLITVQTGNPPPSVQITSPTSGQDLVRTFFVNATVTGQSIRYASLNIDGAQVGNKTAAPFTWTWDSSKLANGVHNITIVAMDGNGKRGSQSIAVTVGNMAPSVTFASPTDTSVGGKISVTANVTSVDPVKEVVLRIDGNIISSLTVSPYTWSIDTNTYAAGGHNLNLTATNVYGLTSYVEMTVNMDNSPPIVVITSPSENSTVFGNASVAVSVLGSTPVTSVAFSLDGASSGNMTASPYVWSFDSRTLSNGVHNMTAKATDANGKVNASTVLFTVNNSGPVVTIDSPADGTNVSGPTSVSVGVSSLQPVSNVTLKVDGQMISSLNATPYLWLWDTSNYTVGTHELQASAIDANGNMGYRNMTVNVQPGTVSIDLTLPEIGTGIIDLAPTITSGEAIRNVLFILDGNVTGNVTGVPYEYSMDSTLVPDGPHRLNVTAVTTSGLRWFKVFDLNIANGMSGSGGESSGPDLHLSAVDLLIMQALIIITVLALVLKLSHKDKGLRKGLWIRKGKEPATLENETEASEEVK
ncbi:MAG TPA: Ig-like domain-containing protein [Methanomassiliicoccales archaeon]